MKRVTNLLPAAITALSLSFGAGTEACTIFSLERDGRVWFGANEDWPVAGFSIWTRPATGGRHGVLYLGFGGEVPTCGINDQGLCFDLASVGTKFTPLDEDKRTSDRFVLMKLMEECSSVGQALDTLALYNLEFLSQSQILLADRSGNSAIVESDSIMVRSDEGLQVIANFRHSGLSGPPTSDRYRVVRQVLSSGPATLEAVRSALAASHQGGTQYSVAFDPDFGEIYFWLFHNYADHVRLDLRQEISRAPYIKPLDTLFPYKTLPYRQLVEKQEASVDEPVSLDSAYLDSVTGTYPIAPGYDMEVTRRGNSLYLRLFGLAPYEMIPVSRDEFYFEYFPARFEITGRREGRVDAVRLKYPFGEIPAQRAR